VSRTTLLNPHGREDEVDDDEKAAMNDEHNPFHCSKYLYAEGRVGHKYVCPRFNPLCYQF